MAASSARARQTGGGEGWWKKGLLFFQPAKALVQKAASHDFVKVDAKAFFSVERTYYKWLHLAVVLIALGGALISFEYAGGPTMTLGSYSPSKHSVGMLAVKHAALNGFILVCAGSVVIVYSLYNFHYRINNIAVQRPARYADRVGPTVLVCMVLCLVVANGIVYLQTSQPPCVDYSSLLGGSAFQPAGVIEHPLKPHTILVVGGGLAGAMAEVDRGTGRVRQFTLPPCSDLCAPPLPPGPAAEGTEEDPLSRRLRSSVYILQVVPPSILEFSLLSEQVTRSWKLPMGPPSGAGAGGGPVQEWSPSGLAFVPEAGHRHGGRFLVAAYGEGRIYTVEVPLADLNASAPAAPVLAGSFVPKGAAAMRGISALDYQPRGDAAGGRLFALLETSVAQIDPEAGAVTRSWPLLFRRFRGLSVDPDRQGAYLTSQGTGTVARIPFDPRTGPLLCEKLF
eukprot:tig00020961_g16667.t1